MYRAQAIFPSNQAGIFLISSAIPPFRLPPFLLLPVTAFCHCPTLCLAYAG
jgi:hypothetical protein